MTVRLGVIGCGGISEAQLGQVWERGLFEPVACADPVEERRTLFTEKFGFARAFADYRDLLAMADVQAVMVCTPTYLHAPVTVAAAEAGKQIFCQKPMAMNTADCRRMIDACERAGVGLQIGFVRRFKAMWTVFREFLDSGLLGAPLLWRQISAGAGPAWGDGHFMNKDRGGGPLLDMCVHTYDMACLCFGEPVDVLSSTMDLNPAVTATDTGTVAVRFESGNQLLLNWSWGLPEGVNGLSSCEILGPKGVLFVPQPMDAYTGRFEDGERPETGDAFLAVLENGVRKVIPAPANALFADELEHFADWVANGGKPRVSGPDGFRAARIAELALTGGGAFQSTDTV